MPDTSDIEFDVRVRPYTLQSVVRFYTEEAGGLLEELQLEYGLQEDTLDTFTCPTTNLPALVRDLRAAGLTVEY